MPAVLALDAGTTSSRALVFAEDGRILAVAQREFRQFYPRPGWVEHDAEEIWQTQIAVAAEAIEKAGVAIGAIGITNQRETTVLWDRATGKPVANAIVWQDRRTADMCDALRAAGHEELIRARTGLVIDAYFSGTKLRWLLSRTDIVPARLAFGTIDSWLVWNLTAGAAHLTDVTNASRTMLFDIHRAVWDHELLSILGIPRSVLPEVRSSGGMFARTAAGLPIPADIPILGIAGDQQSALFGQRCTQAGLAKNTYGTGSFVVMNSGAKPATSSNGLLATIAWRIGDEPVQYALEGSIFVTGAAVQWLRDELHIIKSASEIEELAASVPDTGGVVVVPAFTGLGTPHWDPHARGAILGLTRGSTAAHIARATLESIALQTADVLQAMQEDSGIALAELRVDGGGSTNDLLMQMQADLAGIPVVRTRNHEVTALGAAYLAGLPAPDAQSMPARVFEPAMSSEQREEKISTWRRAADRAKGWASLALVLIVTAACTRGPVQPTWPYPTQFKEVTVDVFAGMSTQGRPVTFTPEQLSGRMLWNLWSGDNATFWNYMVQHGLGTSDLLKVVTWNRAERFEKFGIINQPGFARPSMPDEFGLFIDAPRDAHYDIDRNIDRDTYGRSSGVMGLRLFRNPKFDPARWDVKRFYADEDYYDDPKLERPYLVGMSCSFCHVGPDPVNPPPNVDEPEYANLSDYVGQHYLKVSEVFGLTLDDDNFIKQLLMSNPPGTLDTSFIATDYLNNPGTMNGIYEIGGRLSVATAEEVEGGALDLRNREPVTPRVLKDGADSVGVHAALSRVHVNIGTYWEEWIRHFRPLIGIAEQTPFRVEDAQRRSPHWNWSESHSPALAAYFAFIAKPHKLAEAPGGAKWIDGSRLNRGQEVFAEHCAGCHSSKLREESLQPDFLEGNFLGSEQRYPVTKIQTNAARAVARNALRGHVWDNFSSETYKTLPSVGAITVHDPFTRTDKQWTVPGGGRGYYRPPSLISVWASAPFFHHNTLGKHVHAVDVDSRMAAFNDAIEKLLWPAKREGIIWRTTKESSLKIPAVQLESRILRWLLRDRLRNNAYFLGPIPKGTPVNLLANADLEITSLAKARELAAVLKKERPVAELMALSACPDFIEDRGHYFGTELTDEDKRALIEFVKTF